MISARDMPRSRSLPPASETRSTEGRRVVGRGRRGRGGSCGEAKEGGREDSRGMGTVVLAVAGRGPVLVSVR